MAASVQFGQPSKHLIPGSGVPSDLPLRREPPQLFPSVIDEPELDVILGERAPDITPLGNHGEDVLADCYQTKRGSCGAARSVALDVLAVGKVLPNRALEVARLREGIPTSKEVLAIGRVCHLGPKCSRRKGDGPR